MIPDNKSARVSDDLTQHSFCEKKVEGRLFWERQACDSASQSGFISQMSPLPAFVINHYKVGLEVCFIGEERPRLTCHVVDDSLLFRIDMFSENILNLQNRYLLKHTFGYYSIFIPDDQKSSVAARLHFAVPIPSTPRTSMGYDYIANHAREMLLQMKEQGLFNNSLWVELLIEPFDVDGSFASANIGEMAHSIVRDILKKGLLFGSYLLWNTNKNCFETLVSLDHE